MRLPSRNRESRRISNDLTILTSPSKTDLGEAQVKTYGKTNAPYWCVERRQNVCAFFDAPECTVKQALLRSNSVELPLPTLLQGRTTFEINIEQVELLVSMGNLPSLIDPDEGIFHPLTALCGLVNAHIDCQLRLTSLFLEAQDKQAVLY